MTNIRAILSKFCAKHLLLFTRSIINRWRCKLFYFEQVLKVLQPINFPKVHASVVVELSKMFLSVCVKSIPQGRQICDIMVICIICILAYLMGPNMTQYIEQCNCYPTIHVGSKDFIALPCFRFFHTIFILNTIKKRLIK